MKRLFSLLALLAFALLQPLAGAAQT